MSAPAALQRVFPDSNVLIEGLFAPCHFTPQVAARSGLRIVTPHQCLAQCRLLP